MLAASRHLWTRLVHPAWVLAMVFVMVQGVAPARASAHTSATTAPAQRSAAGLSCQVAYTLTGSAAGSFVAQVVIKNTGTAPINGWTLTWAFPGNQRVTSYFRAFVSQSGANVSARNFFWNATIPAGGTVDFGFQASYTGSNPQPTSFFLNGTLCS